LPGFPTGGGGETVEVRFAPVEPQEEPIAVGEDRALTLSVPGVARYRVGGGSEILIDPEPGVSERNLRVYLLGSAMGALLHQRGLLPLHANAVEFEGRAVAFLGRSGAGKSTLAAWFAARGHRVLCDDVCAILLDESGAAFALPGVPRLRLWKDALTRSGRAASDFEPSFDGQDKYDVPVAGARPDGPLPLAACYLLAGAPAAGGGVRDEGPAGIARLAGAGALEALVANTYRGSFVRRLGATERHLRQCLALARSIPVYRAARRWGEDFFEAEAEHLARHVSERL